MSVVVIGGDYLGSIEKNLYSMGVTELQHITGRKALDKSKVSVPKGTDFILVFTNYVNHATAQTVKEIAKSRAIPLVYAKRSWRAVEEKLKNSHLMDFC
ncbi:MAG: DUF2325 domain-containing protein [Veillonellales bacterium]